MQDKNFVIRDNDREIICNKIVVADQLIDRLKGLMFSQELPDCDGLLIRPCNSIHTFFMLYGIDVLFLDKNFKVIHVKYNLRPWRMTWPYFKAEQVLEMKEGTLKKGIRVGDQLEAVCTN